MDTVTHTQTSGHTDLGSTSKKRQITSREQDTSESQSDVFLTNVLSGYSTASCPVEPRAVRGPMFDSTVLLRRVRTDLRCF